MKAIVNGKIILKDSIVEDKVLLYSNIVEGIVSKENIPDGTEIIDANGGYVAPGFIDLHIHGYLGYDASSGTEESIRVISGGIVKNGVTGYLPTTMTIDMDDIKKSLEAIRSLQKESLTWKGSQILGAHAEGPFINEEKKGAQKLECILKPDASFVEEYSDIIKIITLAPEKDSADFKEIRKIRQNTDVVISMGHTSSTYETAVESTKNGVEHVTHLFNAMTPISHRAPGVVTAALNTDVSCELIADMYHVSPVFYDMLWKIKGRKLVFITDCLSAGGLAHGEYMLDDRKIIYKDNLCRLEDGTIAGSVLALNKGVWNAYTHSNIPLFECVNCASLNPATVIGIEDKKGSLEIGKDADIVILDGEFNVQKTIINGDVRYEA